MHVTYIKLKPIQLHNPHGSREELQFVPARRAAPLCRTQFCICHLPDLAGGRTPAHSARGEAETTRRAGEVEKDVFEGLDVRRHFGMRGGIIIVIFCFSLRVCVLALVGER